MSVIVITVIVIYIIAIMSIIIILVAVVSAIKIFHHDDSFQTLERTHRHTHTHRQTDLGVELTPPLAGSTENKKSYWTSL